MLHISFGSSTRTWLIDLSSSEHRSRKRRYAAEWWRRDKPAKPIPSIRGNLSRGIWPNISSRASFEATITPNMPSILATIPRRGYIRTSSPQISESISSRLSGAQQRAFTRIASSHGSTKATSLAPGPAILFTRAYFRGPSRATPSRRDKIMKSENNSCLTCHTHLVVKNMPTAVSWPLYVTGCSGIWPDGSFAFWINPFL